MLLAIGRYEYSLDAKNRLVVPPPYRNALAAENATHFVLAMFNDSLWLLLPSQWEPLVAEVKAQARSAPDKGMAKAGLLEFYSSAQPVQPDEQWRILIPQEHKDYAKLSKDVMILGAGNRAEIWDRSRWLAYSKRQGKAGMAELAKDIIL